MCNFQELANQASGYVIRCPDCRHWQVGFCNIVLSLGEMEFADWMNYVDRGIASLGFTANPDAKSAVIATPKTGVHLALSHNECLGLAGLLQAADAEWRALQLLELFQS